MENINEFRQPFQKRLYTKNLYTKHDAGLTFLLTVITPQIIGTIVVIGLLIYSSISNTEYETIIENTYVNVLMTAISQLCFVGLFFGYNAIAKINFKKACKVNFKFGIVNLIIALAIGFISLFGFNNLITSFDTFLNWLGHESASMPLPLNNGWWLAVNIVILGILPAFCEEMLFRGMILNGLKQYGRWTAIIVSAALFTLLHGNIDQLIYPFILGIIFGVIADRTNSVVPSIIVHFVNNCTVIVINYIYTINNVQSTSEITLSFMLLSILFAVITAGIIVGLMFLLRKPKIKDNEVLPQISQEEQDDYFNAGKTTNTSLWLGIGVGCLVWIMSLLF